jgi:hypothetical protein
MDKANESLDDDFCDGEIPASTFIRIGQSLDMSGEIDKEELKVIPKRNLLNILSKKTSVIISSNLKK